MQTRWPVLCCHKTYLLWALTLFFIEVFIALFVHDRFIRPYVGDYLVVVLIYCAVKALFNWPVLPVAAGVLLSSYAVEILQYFNLVALLGLQNNRLANVVIGNSFAGEDLLAYTLGIITVVLIELKRSNLPKRHL